MLGAKILMAQGIEVKGLFFKTYFFIDKEIEEKAKQIGINLEIVDLSKEQLGVVKNPKYGYGKNMNPCLDCRILMFKKAKQIMEKQGFDFIATGEVLGERPMTQTRKNLLFIEEKSGLKGKVVRPLSADLFAGTDIKTGYAIQGRSRKKQMELAKKFGLKNYPSPAGGCLLTDPYFSKRLKQLLDKKAVVQEKDIKLLFLGRHFWYKDKRIVVGKNEQENEKIKKLRNKKDVIIELKDIPGPSALVTGEQAIEKAKELVKYYSLKARNKKQVEFKIC